MREGIKDVFPMVAHVLCIVDHQGLCNLDVGYVWGFLEVVNHFWLIWLFDSLLFIYENFH